jgi:RND family efflux transporter MFP subunit
MALIRQAILVLVLGLAALWIWVRFVPSSLTYLDRAGLLSVLRDHDVSLFGLSFLPAEVAPPAQAPVAGAPGRGRGPVQVRVVAAAEGILNNIVTAIGDGQAVRSVTVMSEGAGRIVSIPVRSGQFVERGAVIALLDREAEQIALERARLMLEDTRDRVERQQRLFDSGAVSDVQLRDARLALRTAELEVRQAEFDLRQRSILAPVAGWIGIVSVEVGDHVTSTTSITRLDDRSSILVEFRLPEQFIGRLKLGDTIMAEPLAQPGIQFQGTVTALDNRVDPASRSLRVQAELDNAGDDLRSGMAFKIFLEFPGERHVSVDPLAIQWGDEGSFVWVVRDGKAARVTVRIKQRTPDSVLVTGKLAVGDMVITEGVQMLRPGSDVAPVEAAASRGGPGAAGRVPVDDPGHAPAITPAIAPTDRGRQRALDVPGRQGAGGDHAAKRTAA